jgi:hypothetical protein
LPNVKENGDERPNRSRQVVTVSNSLCLFLRQDANDITGCKPDFVIDSQGLDLTSTMV